MPTRKSTIDVIKVTRDVYTLDDAIALYAQELRFSRYNPLIFARPRKVKGRMRIAMCIARLPMGRDDVAFMEYARRLSREYGSGDCLAETTTWANVFASIDRLRRYLRKRP